MEGAKYLIICGLKARSTLNATSRMSSRHLESNCIPRCIVTWWICPLVFHPSESSWLVALTNCSWGENSSSSERSSGKRRWTNFRLKKNGTPFIEAASLSVVYAAEISRLLYSKAVVGFRVPRSKRCRPAATTLTIVSACLRRSWKSVIGQRGKLLD